MANIAEKTSPPCIECSFCKPHRERQSGICTSYHNLLEMADFIEDVHTTTGYCASFQYRSVRRVADAVVA